MSARTREHDRRTHTHPLKYGQRPQRERERQTDRKKDRDRQRQKDRQADRQTQTHKDTETRKFDLPHLDEDFDQIRIRRPRVGGRHLVVKRMVKSST